MESRHFYKVEANYERYDALCGEYYLDKKVLFQTADNEEEAIKFVISHIRFDFCASDSMAPNGEFVKNFDCKILNKVC